MLERLETSAAPAASAGGPSAGQAVAAGGAKKEEGEVLSRQETWLYLEDLGGPDTAKRETAPS